MYFVFFYYAFATRRRAKAWSSVHNRNNVEATLSNATSRTILSTNCVSTLSKGRDFMINSFDVVAVFGNKSWMLLRQTEVLTVIDPDPDKVERCFDIVADVDGRGFMFSRCSSAAFVRSFVRSSRNINYYHDILWTFISTYWWPD